jgi:hypothetical protein
MVALYGAGKLRDYRLFGQRSVLLGELVGNRIELRLAAAERAIGRRTAGSSPRLVHLWIVST